MSVAVVMSIASCKKRTHEIFWRVDDGIVLSAEMNGSPVQVQSAYRMERQDKLCFHIKADTVAGALIDYVTVTVTNDADPEIKNIIEVQPDGTCDACYIH